ncbi:hypothetical protein INR49_018083, partial [Caranx melampygus]
MNKTELVMHAPPLLILQTLSSVSSELTFQATRPFSAHTDNMLGTLCTLITALTCVSGVTVLTQKPPVVALRAGETATMDCNLGSVTNDAVRCSPTYGSGVSGVTVLTQKPPVVALRTGETATMDCNLGSVTDRVSGVTVVTQKPPVVTLSTGETATMDCNLGSVTNSGARWYKQIPGGAPQYMLSWYHGVDAVKVVTQTPAVHTVSTGQEVVLNCNIQRYDTYSVRWYKQVPGSSLSPPVLTVFPPSSAELQANKASLLCLSAQSGPFAD